jgi:hypothetical protein
VSAISTRSQPPVKIEIIQVPGGTVAQIITPTPEEDRKIVTSRLLEFHLTLPEGENSFPYHVYAYADPNSAFTQHGRLGVRRSDDDDGLVTVTSQDARFVMREVDHEALLYGVERPFTFPIRLENSSPVPSSVHKELAIGGRFYAPEGTFDFNNVKGLDWEITIS